jgi:hypothetical protein
MIDLKHIKHIYIANPCTDTIVTNAINNLAQNVPDFPNNGMLIELNKIRFPKRSIINPSFQLELNDWYPTARVRVLETMIIVRIFESARYYV